ncbi:hypothetical protein CWI42_031160 [Ordospora colligata]|uniref:Uncharacterized protein n=1 Tax=Ordospora colligata OC4 TaxID=1354746 RepID=A0A0B2UMA1_9MICR|nr:uncharacterized protein M896_030870 [Ordospora colligata OC4]KHN70100.1 hypothetical protein M896_030870 [Ordospora colligata OC4]TBU16482.1 hypothetical protein CWI41_030830 [Ordospora colligata]TBU16667.1 hypothetical protein CWI40_031230 [Ordospora colligata]TBU19240.1 hypothetical protein CWI42_031160 [Ordospora colligata]
MHERDVIAKIEKIFEIEDPSVVAGSTKDAISEILEGAVFPISHPFYTDFILFSLDVLYPDVEDALRLLKNSGFTKEQFEASGLRKAIERAAQVNGACVEEVLKMYDDSMPKRRKKVSWDANLITIKEIERTVMESDVQDVVETLRRDPRSSKRNANVHGSPKHTNIQERQELKWIKPIKIDTEKILQKSSGMIEEEIRESSTIMMQNTEEHRKFTPVNCTTSTYSITEENETKIIPVITFAKGKAFFDFKKIVEERHINKDVINQILDDADVISAIILAKT